MFREVRKKKNEISLEETVNLLKSCRIGVLAVNGDDGYPYCMPINYFYDQESNKIIFHGSRIGHKVDSLKKCDKVCFTVFGNETIKDEPWAPYGQSAVVFGKCHLASREETEKLCKEFAMKYYPSEQMVDEEIQIGGKAVQMFVIDVEHLSGKEVQQR